MKKATLLKAMFGLALVLMTASAWGQANTPNNTVDIVSDLNAINYVEINQNGALAGSASNTAIGLAGTTAATASTHTNLITVGSDGTGAQIVEITGTGTATDTTGMYAVTQPAYAFTIPMIVVPDQILSPGSFNSTDGTLTHSALNSTWTWTIDTDLATGGIQAATSATLTTPTSIPASFASTGTGFTNALFNQKVLNSGTDVETLNVTVVENSMNSDGSSVLCTGPFSYVGFSIVAAPTAVENTTNTDADIEECLSTLENSQYTLEIDLKGYPPFAIGYYVNEATISGGTTTNNFTYTYVVTGSATTNTSTDQASKYTGTLTGAGDTWKYTILLGVDSDDSETYTNRLIMDAGGKITKYQVGVNWVNDHISRKSDRLGTLGTPDVVGEAASHMLFDASGHLALTMYPTPATGNIFTLPN